MINNRQFIITQLALTGDFLQNYVFLGKGDLTVDKDLTNSWLKFLERTGLAKIPVLKKKVFLDASHIKLSYFLLRQGFEVCYAANEYSALYLDLIFRYLDQVPRGLKGDNQRDPVLVMPDDSVLQGLSTSVSMLAKQNQIIVLSGQSQTLETRPFVDQWIDVSQTTAVVPRYQEESWQDCLPAECYSNTNLRSPSGLYRNHEEEEKSPQYANASPAVSPVAVQSDSAESRQPSVTESAAPPVSQETESESAPKASEMRAKIDLSDSAALETSDKREEKRVEKRSDKQDEKRESKPFVKAAPDVSLWKDRIQKALDSYVEGKGGRIPVERTILWLYSLQLNCDINALNSHTVLIDPGVYALLRDNLPNRVRWMEESDGVAELFHINQPEIQPIPAQQAAEQLQIGAKLSSDPEEGAPWPISQTIPELGHVIECADLLSHYCRWTRQKSQLGKQGETGQNEISKAEESYDLQAQKLSLYNWIKWNSFEKESLYDDLASCYDALIASFRLLKQVQEGVLESNELKNVYKKSAQIAADVQCTLKSWLRDQNFDISVDHVLNEAYRYLVELAREEQFFLYHLKAVDVLSLSELKTLNDEINALREQFFSKNVETKQQKKLKGKLEYDVKKLLENRNSVEQWNRIIRTATELMDDLSMPPSDLFFRQVFQKILPKLPDDAETTDSFGRLVQEIEVYQSRLDESASAPLDLVVDNILPASVQKVRQKFGGTHVVFIGGEPKEHIIKRVEERLNLKVYWNSTNHGDSLSRYDKALNDPDISLFLIYIPWCSHKHSEELAGLVQQAGKTLIRLKKGTNPDMIAEAICFQALGRH